MSRIVWSRSSTTMRPKDHRDLAVWQRAQDLAVLVHETVEELTLPNQIAYGAQLRRAAASIGANISEGFARQHRGELIQYLSIARASLAELDFHIGLIGRLNLVRDEKLAAMCEMIDHVSRMLTRLIQVLRKKGDK